MKLHVAQHARSEYHTQPGDASFEATRSLRTRLARKNENSMPYIAEMSYYAHFDILYQVRNYPKVIRLRPSMRSSTSLLSSTPPPPLPSNYPGFRLSPCPLLYVRSNCCGNPLRHLWLDSIVASLVASLVAATVVSVNCCGVFFFVNGGMVD